MTEKTLTRISVTEGAVDAWSSHLEDAFNQTLFTESAKKHGARFVGANMPGKRLNVLFYFRGLQTWASWPDKEIATAWESMHFAFNE